MTLEEADLKALMRLYALNKGEAILLNGCKLERDTIETLLDLIR